MVLWRDLGTIHDLLVRLHRGRLVPGIARHGTLAVLRAHLEQRRPTHELTVEVAHNVGVLGDTVALGRALVVGQVLVALTKHAVHVGLARLHVCLCCGVVPVESASHARLRGVVAPPDTIRYALVYCRGPLVTFPGAALPGRASHPQHAPHLACRVAKAATPTRALTALLTLRLLVVGGDVGDCYTWLRGLLLGELCDGELQSTLGGRAWRRSRSE
mmetsp:Transcript_36574/g.87783  ORF Transcript_36574/g.87783 Transcript_36574/m.87783 type:complete len:216 (+) Transcript_36574:435-1082(+)